MMKREKITDDLKMKAKRTDLVHYLLAKHPDSIQYAPHPDKPQYVCWRGTKHDSITFYVAAAKEYTAYRYTRWSTYDPRTRQLETDDGIGYLVKYENYRFNDAVLALAYFRDDIAEEDFIEKEPPAENDSAEDDHIPSYDTDNTRNCPKASPVPSDYEGMDLFAYMNMVNTRHDGYGQDSDSDEDENGSDGYLWN